MNFGSWDNVIHENSEQVKRIATAKKADTTPAFVDRENKTAEFKGSGKNPYKTTLDSCSCVDFARRKLPCKHIYRLALELEDADDVQQGVNKNEHYTEFYFDIFGLPVESQEMLYDMCVAKIFHGQEFFVFERNEYSELLFYKGFCIQNVPTLDVMNTLPVSAIKKVLFSSGIEWLPEKRSQKKTFIIWFSDNIKYAAPLIDKKFIFLEFSEDGNKFKNTIHRRFAKKFERTVIENEDGETIEHLIKKFTNDTIDDFINSQKDGNETKGYQVEQYRNVGKYRERPKK